MCVPNRAEGGTEAKDSHCTVLEVVVLTCVIPATHRVHLVANPSQRCGVGTTFPNTFYRTRIARKWAHGSGGRLWFNTLFDDPTAKECSRGEILVMLRVGFGTGRALVGCRTGCYSARAERRRGRVWERIPRRGTEGEPPYVVCVCTKATRTVT